jgi:fructose-1,6-bisphosphatase/inositol monophosphatase family enzyme/ADP-ribosylglycohydrolase
MELGPALEVALAAARAAGDILGQDLRRPGGARGSVDKAEADLEAEREIRARLQGAFPDWGYLGEETGRGPGKAGKPVWLVDPNDGTRDYLMGRRGSAVSIGLLAEGRPRLGVVFAFAYPDGQGDLFAWAEGCGPLRRNGQGVRSALSPRLAAHDVVLVSSQGDDDPEANLRCADPARFRSVPSVAHRLALVAAGEAAAATSLFAPGAWDYAAGHALVRAAGGVLVNEAGTEVTYDDQGASQSERAFAGDSQVARELARRPWERKGKGEESAPGDGPIRLRRGEAVAEPGLLARAQGCLLGLVAGGNWGAPSRLASPAPVAALHPDRPRLLRGSGEGQVLAGQPSQGSELALALGRSILAQGAYDAGRAAAAYAEWLGSLDGASPAARAAKGRSNDSLVRAASLAIYAHPLAAPRAVELARQDSALTHSQPVCGDAAAALVVAVRHALEVGDGPEPAYRAALDWARSAAAPPVAEALEAASTSPPPGDQPSTSLVLTALQSAFNELLHAPSLEEGVVASVRRGGDAEANAAVAGALLGAVHGRQAVPAQWRSMVLSCRPHPLRTPRPRPASYWPVHVLELAERLLLAGRTP